MTSARYHRSCPQTKISSLLKLVTSYYLRYCIQTEIFSLGTDDVCYHRWCPRTEIFSLLNNPDGVVLPQVFYADWNCLTAEIWENIPIAKHDDVNCDSLDTVKRLGFSNSKSQKQRRCSKHFQLCNANHVLCLFVHVCPSVCLFVRMHVCMHACLSLPCGLQRRAIIREHVG